MKVTIVGSGDAFGSGGRSHTCFHVVAGSASFLIDYGASAPVAMNRAGLALNDIDAIFISHLHGDHFGGLPFAVLDASHINKRSKSLTIFGPPGIEARYLELAEAMFRGMTTRARGFDLVFKELQAHTPSSWSGLQVDAFEVEHPSGAPSHGLRFSGNGKTLAYSGDTQWCDNVISIGRHADLYLLECYSFEDKKIPYHMNWHTIARHLPQFGARQIVLTHMGAEMLSHINEIKEPGVCIGQDGLVLEV